jgi:hypothetical protein
VKTPKKFLGVWRIIETEIWDRDALDRVVPAHIDLVANGPGRFRMIAVEGDLDCRFDGSRVEFSWIGHDEGDACNGRGWAEIGDDGVMRGRIYFHQGDDSSFVAKRKE